MSFEKNGCYADLLKAASVPSTNNHSKAFEYQIFKGADTESTSQDITCAISMCKDYCKVPSDQSECPVDDIMNYRLA